MSLLTSAATGALLIALGLSSAFAHEVRPAYLELRQTAPETYAALWKVPGLGEDLRLGLYVELPAGCTNINEPRATMVNNAYTERWTVKCAGGLTGGTIHIAGLSATMTDVLVRLERLDGTTQVTRLTPSAPSFVVEAAPRALEVARTYTVLGVEHILSGIDHLLFVLALILICLGTGAKGVVTKVRALHLFLDTRHWTLLKTVTAFTLSHSITLSLAALGYIHVPQPPVEAAIALSIVFVASEILRMRSAGFSPLQPENDGGVKEISDTSPMRTLKRTEVRAPSLTARAPWVVAFSFGLMHGLGFASGLSEAGLPAGHIPPALLFFSIGVEAGHFLFIGVFLSLITLAVRVKLPAPRWAQLVPPYAIGGVAMFWVIQRIAAF